MLKNNIIIIMIINYYIFIMLIFTACLFIMIVSCSAYIYHDDGARY